MVIFHPAAAEDAHKTYVWYEHERAGVGEKFSDALIKTVDHLQELPLSFPTCKDMGTVRRARIPGFPYHVYYEYDLSVATILAIVHMDRNPETIGAMIGHRADT